MSIFKNFEKKKDFLICIDSDGCAMDTMDIKHMQCFGPCMVEEWNLGEWRTALLNRWNDQNLYTMTRGINRFTGLSMALDEVHRQCTPVEGIDEFVAWANEAVALSEAAIKEVIKTNPSPIFAKALAWSQAVNHSIETLNKDELAPFDGVKQAIEEASKWADIAIVSSANQAAVVEEWERYHLMEYVDICLTQQVGTKAYCIGKMLEKNYEKHHVLMVGDAPGDKQAAEQNGVLYYPILVKREAQSWTQFVEEALKRFIEGRYDQTYQMEQNKAFVDNLS